jgi:hypothetical protein
MPLTARSARVSCKAARRSVGRNIQRLTAIPVREFPPICRYYIQDTRACDQGRTHKDPEEPGQASGHGRPSTFRPAGVQADERTPRRFEELNRGARFVTAPSPGSRRFEQWADVGTPTPTVAGGRSVVSVSPLRSARRLGRYRLLSFLGNPLGSPLQDGGHAHPAGGADRYQPATTAALCQELGQHGQNARARCPKRVTDGNAAAF